MATTKLSLTTVVGPYPDESGSVVSTDISGTAGDNTNGNHIIADGPVMLVFNNTDAAQQTVTLPTSQDPYGRLSGSGGSETLTLEAGEIHARIVTPTGYEQASAGSGKIEFTVSAATILVTAVKLY